MDKIQELLDKIKEANLYDYDDELDFDDPDDEDWWEWSDLEDMFGEDDEE